MAAGAHPPMEPVNTTSGSGLAEPVYLPSLRRPVGWRELDSQTLLLRVHGLFAAHCSSMPWPDSDATAFLHRHRSGPDEAAGTGRTAWPSTEHALGQEWAHKQSLLENPATEQTAGRGQPAKASRRISGWILSATLVIAALQLAMLVVAISPLEVIENFKQSARQWQLKQQSAGAFMTEQSTLPSSDTPRERATWWKSWQSMPTSGLLTNSTQESSEPVPRKGHSSEASK